MGEIFQQAVSLTASLNIWLVLTIFAISLVAEFGFSIPYLLETIWLIIGYNVIAGYLPPVYLLLFCSTTLIGREIGAGALYKVSGYGRTPLARLYQKMADDLDKKPSGTPLKKFLVAPVIRLVHRFLVMHVPHKAKIEGVHQKVNAKPFCPSTFNIVLGRFAWLKIPITITMGLTRRPLRLLLGVGLFSLAWDGLYILIGVLGAGGQINPLVMAASTIGVMFVVNAIIYFFRRRSSRYASSG